MADATASFDARAITNRNIVLGVAAATKIYPGTIVNRNASGHAVKGTSAASHVCVGVALHEADNTAGAAADITVTCLKGPFGGFTNDATNPLTIADIGGDCYIVDDNTLAKLDASNPVIAGKFLGFDVGGKVICDFA